jgi:hypothetical protein
LSEAKPIAALCAMMGFARAQPILRSLEELKKVNPKDETGRRRSRHFQWLTKNIGYPKLREQLGAVVATMKLSADWPDFKAKLDKNYPRLGKPTQLSFDYASEEAADTGRGL